MNALKRISCHNFIEVDGYAYFSNWFYNGLFKVEIKTGKTFFLGSFEGEKFFEPNIHWKIGLKEDRIYFFPRRGFHMHIYHLSDKTMQAIEIRKKTEKFFIIDNIILEGDYIIFLPQEKSDPIRRWDENTYKVTTVNGEFMIQEKLLYELENNSLSAIIEKNRIRFANQISWKKLSDGNWYSFMPLGKELLCYSEEKNNLKIVPLVVNNPKEYQEHLHKVKMDFAKIEIFYEFWDFKVQNLINREVLSVLLKKEDDQENKYGSGKMIWKKLI